MQGEVILGVFQGSILRGTAGGTNTGSIFLVYCSISAFSTAQILSTCSISDVCTARPAYTRSLVLIVIPVLEVYLEYVVYWEHLCNLELPVSRGGY